MEESVLGKLCVEICFIYKGQFEKGVWSDKQVIMIIYFFTNSIP